MFHLRFNIPVILVYSPSNGTLFFCNNIKSKMGILNLIRKMYFNPKTLTKNIFLKLVYVFINAVIGWNFNILNVFCQITFPSCTLGDIWINDYQLNINHVYTNIRQFTMHQWVLNVVVYWLTLMFISIVNNLSVI